MKIINLTQHPATPEQLAAGVFDVPAAFGERERLVALLTFEDLPSSEFVRQRAEGVATYPERHGAEVAMIGGAPFLMAPLEKALRERGIRAVYAFSRRESVEESQPDGSVRKTNVFRHVGFVEGALPPR